MRLSFENYARNAYESVRPDLWPVVGVYPMLGIQGDTIWSLTGQGSAGNVGGSWDLGPYGWSLRMDSTVDQYVNHTDFSLWQPLMSGSSPWTLQLSGVWHWRNTAGGSGSNNVIGFINSVTAPTNRFAISYSSSYGPSVWTATVGKAWSGKSTTTGTVTTGGTRPFDWFIAWDGAYLRSWVLRDGQVIFTGLETECVASNFSGDTVTSVRIPQGHSIAGHVNWYSQIALHHKAMTLTQMRELSADPLLPLRRRAVQPYWVLGDVPVGVFKPAWAKNVNTLIAS